MRSPSATPGSPRPFALEDAEVSAGTLIGGRYRVVAPIGAGGMARVYDVEHAELGRHFALKLLHPKLVHERAQVERFEQEARAVARLESPHIVGVVDCGFTESGAPYFVMELLHGNDLRRLLSRDGQLPAARAIHIALDVCRALDVAHAAGIVHRDLKPENIFVTRDAAGKEHCKLLDFGIVKLTQANPTLPGALVGTVRYMAPEQLGSDQPIQPATDFFALGVTLFECLTGAPPFDADTFERVLFKIMNDLPPDLLTLRPDLHPAFATLVTRLLAKDPAQRPASALACASELARFITADPTRRAETIATTATIATPASASAETSPETTALPGTDTILRDATTRSRSRVLAAAFALAFALALGTLLWITGRDMPPAEPVRAEATSSPLPPSPLLLERPSTAAPFVTPTSVPSIAASTRVSPSTGAQKAAPPIVAPATAPSVVAWSRPLRPSAASAARKTEPPPELPLFYPREPKSP